MSFLSRGAFLLAFSISISACFRFMGVKENFAPAQVTETSVLRKPGGEKSWGLFPKYDTFLEGYLCGSIVGLDGRPLEGVEVKVLDAKGAASPRFTPGVTDAAGLYKIRFSLPIRWRTVDFVGTLAPSGAWKTLNPQPEFRLYFSQSNGLLFYSDKATKIVLRNGQAVISSPQQRAAQAASEPQKNKKSDDFFGGGFDFGP